VASIVAAKKNSLARFVLESTPTYEFGKPACCKQGCHGDGRTDTFVRPSCPSDKALLHQIRVNAMLTSDRVKLELLCPWWLPHRCHIGLLDASFHYIIGVGGRTAWWGHIRLPKGRSRLHEGCAWLREGHVRLGGGAHGSLWINWSSAIF
jgi:hypothetical protein